MSLPSRQQTAPPYWVSGGEFCGFCWQEYLLEAECRCIECDEPVCPMCAVTIRETSRLVCPACHEQTGHPKRRRVPK